MALFTECPDAEQLQLLVLGRLADDAAEALERHVECCDRCGDVLRVSAAEDTLVAAMRDQATRVLHASESVTLDQLTKRLRDLVSADPNGLVSSALGDRNQEFDPETLLKPAQQEDELGRLGPYRVLELLGCGGMGAVFRAEDLHLQRSVALKVMLPNVAKKESARERFLAEARAAAKIEHDHIVTIYQVGDDDGVPYVAMPLLKGLTLEEFARRHEALVPGTYTPVDEILRIGREVAAGLAAAHKHGLVHRDIKPANIWLDAASGGRAKILDFGLVQPAAEDVQSTARTMIAGTAAYMAPEQARGELVNARADLFSLGCVLYRLATGREPWRSDDLQSTLTAVATQASTPVRELNPAIPVELAELITRLLAKDPAQRPESAQRVVHAIERIERLREQGSATLPGTERRRLTPALWLLVMVFFAAAFAGAVFYVKTDAGTLQIETFDDDVRVVVEQGGKVIEVIDVQQGTKVRLQRGEYELRLESERRDVRLDKNRIEITRSGTVIARIEKTSPPPGSRVDDSRSIVNSLGMRLASIPAGKFVMGSPPEEPGRNEDEQQHEVVLSRPFYLGVVCVTVGQFREFIRSTSYQPEGGDAWESPGYLQTDNLPVGNVSWNDAVAFCEWLTKKEGRKYRLPTEAEWEYACRADTRTAYFFGNDPRYLLEYAIADAVKPRPMGPIKPNPWGLYDMCGNQWQWTADWYAADYYEHSPKQDPPGPAEGVTKVMRGSSYSMPPRFSRSASRHGNHETTWYKPHVGFRVLAETSIQAP